MATWRPVGKITPVVGEWRFWDEEVEGTMFRLNCAPLPDSTPSYLWLREWRDEKPGEKKLVYPKTQQTFTFGQPGKRLIEVCKLYPLWAQSLDEDPYDLGLEERVSDPPPAVEEQPSKPWVGYH